MEMADDYTNLLLSYDEPCILQSPYSQYDYKSLLINATKVSNGPEVSTQQSCSEFAAHPERASILWPASTWDGTSSPDEGDSGHRKFVNTSPHDGPPSRSLSYYTESTYGSLPNVPGNSGQGPKPRRIIFCVHGKSSGCCSITEGEVIERPRGSRSGSASTSESYAQQDAPVNGHCHRERDENVDRKARKKLIIASILCVIFMIGEVVGGYLSSSLAIATDAAHLLTDFASFMISLFSLWVASRPPTRRMSFGWYRAEVIGALTSVLMIWIITGVLVYLAIDRIVNENFEIDSVIMLITSAVGVVVNIVMGFTLHQHSHSHSHHSHESETNHSHQENINVRAAFIHVVGDLIQSLGVFIAALIIFFKPSWLIVDPICTFLFSGLVLLTTFAILKDTIMVLMEGIPKGIDFAEVLNTFLQIDGVLKVHNLRIWALSLDKTALSAHLAIRPGVSAQNILTQASRRIHARFKLFEMTLQIEEFVENMEECVQCQCPEK